jgi:hypothetical protein
VATYFDLSAANARIAELRPLLVGLRVDRDAAARSQRHLEQMRVNGDNGHAELEREQEALTVLVRRMAATVRQIDAWGITLRDIGAGLVDFPALASGRPIWLCWRLGEGDIAWWHELEAGVAGRRPLIDLE